MTLGTLFLFAPSGQSSGAGMSIFFIQMLAIVAIFYFLIIRPKVQQERKHRQQLEQIKRGDEVVTAGGIIGEVLHIKDDRLTVKSGEARLIIQRDRIAAVLPPGGEPEPKKK